MAKIKLRNKKDINEPASKTLYNVTGGTEEDVNPGAKTGPNKSGKKNNVASVVYPGTNFQIKLKDNNTKVIHATNSSKDIFAFPFTALYFENGKLSPDVAVNENGGGGGDTPTPIGPGEDSPVKPVPSPDGNIVLDIQSTNWAKTMGPIEDDDVFLSSDNISNNPEDPIYMDEGNNLYFAMG